MVEFPPQLREETMKDFEKLMLAIYKATIEQSQPFADYKAVLAAAQIPDDSAASIILSQRGFLNTGCPVGSFGLSESGINYVESRLLRGA